LRGATIETKAAAASVPDSPYASVRQIAALAIMTIGSSGMFIVPVAVPPVQAEFDVSRSAASLPYTLTMLGIGLGGILMGRVVDRFGIMLPRLGGALCLGIGYVAVGFSTDLWQFALAHGVLISFLGSSATFGALIADTSHWLRKHRGVAVAIVACGNYLAGAIWPPVVRRLFDTVGWRQTMIGFGVFCVAPMVPLALVLWRRSPVESVDASADVARIAHRGSPRWLGLTPGQLQDRALHCRHRLLRGDGDAAGPHRRPLRRSRPWRRAWRGDALDHGVVRHRESVAIGLDVRPDRWLTHATARIGAPSDRVAALRVFRWLGVALRDLRAFRFFSGWHRAGVCDHRARVLRAA
jgi:hypothetical protein